MAVNMRNELLNASRVHFEAHIEKHRVNVENLLQNSAGVGEHSDLMDTIEKELEEIIELLESIANNVHYGNLDDAQVDIAINLRTLYEELAKK